MQKDETPKEMVMEISEIMVIIRKSNFTYVLFHLIKKIKSRKEQNMKKCVIEKGVSSDWDI